MNKKTLILGDINTGKTGKTAQWVRTCCERGLGAQITILDMAPEPIQGIGGKLPKAPSPDVLLLTCPIIAPRLTGIDDTNIQLLAEQNAQALEPLIGRALRAGRNILVINDATLYLQTGNLNRMLALLDAYPTAIINAYQGRGLPSGPLTERERNQVEALTAFCDPVVRLP